MKTIYEQLLSAEQIKVFKRDSNDIATHAISFVVSRISARKFCVTKEILSDGKLFKRQFISGSGRKCLSVLNKLDVHAELEKRARALNMPITGYLRFLLY